ncbi:MAG: CaiB/BaiF CoA transferase family protein, partial [Pollutimonas bauzanensis]
MDGVRVLDLSRVVAGNMASLLLADFGAEVIKVEAPGRGDTLREWNEDGVAVFWKVYGRNKKSITLDIRTPRGKEMLEELVGDAQVLLENFRPGVLERLGFSPERLHELNSRLVVVRVSGWGQTGPYSKLPGFGSLVEALSGFAAKNGFADKPPALPNMALADMVAGLYGAYATLIALREVECKGNSGQVIDLSLLEPMISILGPDIAAYRVTGQVPPRSGNRASVSAPRNIYATRDGKYVA